MATDTVDQVTNSVRRNAFYTNGRPDPEISVQVKRIAGSPEAALTKANKEHFGMGVLRVSDVEQLGFDVIPKPLTEDASHAIIVGVSTKSDCDRLAETTKIVKLPS
ncbi:MAG: hypothetical protein H0W06_00750 [Chloroflexia bacterium]|nr:hypothetical protein [Chloroflexia bacterium]